MRVWLVGLVTLAFVLGCGSGETTEEAAPSAPEAAPEAASGPTLVSLVQGDIACYAELAEGGNTRSEMADFDLCPGGGKDASALVGKPVSFTTRQENVQAASCQGDPECQDTQQVDLIVTLTAR